MSRFNLLQQGQEVQNGDLSGDDLLRALLAEVRALSARFDEVLFVKSRYQRQKARQHAMLREVAAATRLGPTMANARRLAAILAYAQEAPDGCAALIEKLRSDPTTPRSARGLYRILAGENDTNDTPF